MILTSDPTTLRDIDLRSKMAAITTFVGRELSSFRRISSVNEKFDLRSSLVRTIDADGRENRALEMSRGKDFQRRGHDRPIEDHGEG